MKNPQFFSFPKNQIIIALKIIKTLIHLLNISKNDLNEGHFTIGFTILWERTHDTNFSSLALSSEQKLGISFGHIPKFWI